MSRVRIPSPAPLSSYPLSISLEATNVGERAADEVVQLYHRDLRATVTRPLKELRGFARATLEPGGSTTVTFGLAVEQLAFTGVDGELRIEPGHHRVMVGTSSADLPLEGGFEVIGEVRTLPVRSRFFSNVEIGRPPTTDPGA